MNETLVGIAYLRLLGIYRHGEPFAFTCSRQDAAKILKKILPLFIRPFFRVEIILSGTQLAAARHNMELVTIFRGNGIAANSDTTPALENNKASGMVN